MVEHYRLMDATTAQRRFEQASRYDAELTDRQHDVLRLISTGKTNAEIADQLGITLAGAKWHVSELLTKLGLDSREAAADYYRWRRSPGQRTARTFRGLISASSLKFGLVAVAATAAGAVAVGVLLALHRQEIDLGPAEPGLPFYMEAVVGRNDTYTTTAADVRYWYGDDSHLRIESETPKVTRQASGHEVRFADSDGFGVIVFDGARSWQGSTAGGSLYWSRDLLGPDRAKPFGFEGTYLGPLTTVTFSEYLSNHSPEVRILRLGADQMLGRRVEMLEWREVADERIQRREWIDPERMLVFRMEIPVPDADGLVISAQVRRLQYGMAQDPARFVFQPAAGTFELTCKSSTPLRAGDLPEPFLSVPQSALPDSWKLKWWDLSATSSGECGKASLDFATAPDLPALLEVRENAEDPPSALLADGEPTHVALQPARLRTEPDGSVALTWVWQGVGISLKSHVLSGEELINLSEAMVRLSR